jgi:hypothetical protein
MRGEVVYFLERWILPRGGEQFLAELDSDARVECAYNGITEWDFRLRIRFISSGASDELWNTCLVTARMILGR